MPFRQVRALMRQDRLQLAVIQAGQRPAGEHDPVPARQAVHRGTVRVDDLNIRGRSGPGQDGQDIIVDRPAVPRCRGRRAVTPCHAAQDRQGEQRPGGTGRDSGW